MKILESFKRACLDEQYPIMTDEVLTIIVKMIENHSTCDILELGSCVGYSAITIATNTSAHIISIERDIERHILAKENVKTYQLESQINMIYDDALDYQPQKRFDMIIFDAAKAQNQAFLDKYFPFLKEKGKIIIDNVDFHGQKDLVDEITSKNLKNMMRKLKQFEEDLQKREDLMVTYQAVGDGILIIEKKC